MTIDEVVQLLLTGTKVTYEVVATISDKVDTKLPTKIDKELRRYGYKLVPHNESLFFTAESYKTHNTKGQTKWPH